MIKKNKKLSEIKPSTAPIVKEYVKTLADIKKHVREAQVKAALSANKELLKLYWYIGQTIAQKQKENNWGSNIIEKLSNDLQNSSPGMAGFSRANAFKMRAFYIAYEIVSQAVRQFHTVPIFNIPWDHNVVLLTKIKNNDKRLWYAQKTIDNGWSKNLLEASIKT